MDWLKRLVVFARDLSYPCGAEFAKVAIRQFDLTRYGQQFVVGIWLWQNRECIAAPSQPIKAPQRKHQEDDADEKAVNPFIHFARSANPRCLGHNGMT